MIASLRGTLAAREPVPVVEVGGIGFKLHVSARTAAALPRVGGQVGLATYLHVREDQLSLYGFSTEQERALFLLLLGVSGIGPRSALALLSSAPPDEFGRAVADGDETYLCRLPGVGRKMAARLVVELRGKIVPRVDSAARLESASVFEEAVLALTSLGLSERAARDAIESVPRHSWGDSPRVEDIVRAALQSSSKDR